MSAENHNPSGPADGAPGGATEPNHAPDSVRGGVVTSHGEREKRAYVAPVEIPRRHQRMATIDMSKVRISPEMKVPQQLDPRAMPTTKMDIPPGGIRPPPPPAQAEVADPQSASRPEVAGASPWSQNAGIDRSMLPSAAMAQPPPAQAQRIPSMPPPITKTKSPSIGAGVWIAVILVAALLGGGIALFLKSSSTSGSAEPVSSSAPIAITVPSTTPAVAGTDTPDEPEIVEPNAAASAEGDGASTTSPKTTAPRTAAPRRTSPSKTSAPAPAPAPITTRPRLFN